MRLLNNVERKTLEANELSGGLGSSKIVLTSLSFESDLLARKRNAVDVKCLVSALYPKSVARAQRF